jgi:hypothetical protein
LERHHNSILELEPTLRPVAERRFWAKVEKTEDCWIWKGAKTTLGYGFFRMPGNRKGPSVYAHRISYELANGRIPEGRELDHLCRNPPCIKPDHLEAVSHKENLARGEGPFPEEKRKTHCLRGHPLTIENCQPSALKLGHRNCKICHNINRNARRHARMSRGLPRGD